MSLYIRQPAFVLGFHGCDQTVKDRVLRHNEDLQKSTNTWDWLGHGIYFWENDPTRAMEWAVEADRRKRAAGENYSPAVIGAIIDLGNCFDLMNRYTIEQLVHGYKLLENSLRMLGKRMPQNKELRSDLDCAVIEALHRDISMAENLHAYDTVRGLFTEGEPIYSTSRFMKKTHIQICVRNKDCIKGYFDPLRPREMTAP